jgi:hypothetical protein
MNILELRDRDPKRFEEEYYKWYEYAPDYEWWEYIFDNFKKDCMTMGVYVDNITFSGFHSQRDGASFAGRMYICDWMEAKGYDKTHLAAYIASKDDGSYVTLDIIGTGNSMRASYGGWENGVGPSGIFAELDDQTWDGLVNDQISDLSIEDEVLSFCEDLAHKLYRDLELEYEHLTSKSMFIEHCECNEVEFEDELSHSL